MSTPFDRLRARARRDPGSPFVTWYGPGQDRAELSGITFATSVAKTAGMLTDDLDLEPGDRIRLNLPLHWSLPVWVAAADLAGLSVVWDGPGIEGAADVTVFSESPAGEPPRGQVVVSAATAFGRPEHPVPAPYVDHFTTAMGQPDVYLRVPASGTWLVDGAVRSADDLLAGAQAAVARVPAGGHVLVPTGTPAKDAALVSWLGPLLTGGSCVLVQAGDADRLAAVAAAEHAVFAAAP